MRQVIPIPFGKFAPDERKRDSPNLERVEGLVPWMGAYRPLPKTEIVTSVASTEPVTGSHAHLVTFRAATQDRIPGPIISIGSVWLGEPDDVEEHDEILQDELDATYWGWMGDSTGPDEASRTIKVDLSDQLKDPGTDDGHLFSVRYEVLEFDDMPTWSLNFKLVNTSDSSVVATITIDETDVPVPTDSFQTKSILLTPAERALIIDYADLEYNIVADKTVTPGAITVEEPTAILETFNYFEPDKVEEGYDDVDYLVDETDYLISQLSLDGAGMKVAVGHIPRPSDFDTAPDARVELTVKAAVKHEDSFADASLALYVAGGVEPLVNTDPAVSIPDLAGDPAMQYLELEVTKLDLVDVDIEDWSNLRAYVDAIPSGGGEPGSFNPDGQDNVLNFSPTGKSTNWEAVGFDDTDYDADIYTSPGAIDGSSSIIMIFPPITEPVDGSEVSLHVMVRSISGNAKLIFGFQKKGTTESLQDKTVSPAVSDGIVEESFILNDTLYGNINWPGLKVRFRTPTDTTTNQITAVHACWIEAKEPTDGGMLRIYTLSIEHATSAGFKVSQLRLDLPVEGKELTGDTSLVYAGTKRSLYEVSEAGFVDVSNTADQSYGQLVNRPHSSWKFVSWGNKVIASNGTDPVQIQHAINSRFEDLWTDVSPISDEKPYARLMAVVKDSLVVANIMLAPDTQIPSEGQPDFNEFTVWAAEINFPERIQFIDLTNQSWWQPVYNPAGELVALMGGEKGTLFKRNSIYRMSYIGLPWIFDVDTISYNEGTAYGRSPVQIDREVFFLGNGGFRYINPGGGVQAIGDGEITKMFIDSLNEDRALQNNFGATTAVEIEAAVFGVYDTLSRLIIWSYRGVSDNAYRNGNAVVLDPSSGSWSHIPDVNPGVGLSDIISQANVQNPKKSIFRNMVMFSWDETTIHRMRFSDDKFPSTLIEGKVLSSKFLQSGVQGSIRNPREVVTIQGVRLFTETDKHVGRDNPASCEFSLTIMGALDPKFKCSLMDGEASSDSENIDEHGFFMLDEPVSGSFFHFLWTFPESEYESVREVYEYELDVDIGEGEE